MASNQLLLKKEDKNKKLVVTLKSLSEYKT
jgi:hypothetical protein